MEMPMLDEEEFAQIAPLFSKVSKARSGNLSERFRPVLDKYFELTGFMETNQNAIWHHRISLYGPPCEKCGKPYRTSVASFCAACGNKRAAS